MFMLFFSVYTIGCMDWWSNWVNLAKCSFGVLSVHVLPKLSVVIIRLEHFTLVEWCLVVYCVIPYILILYAPCSIVYIDWWSNWVYLARNSFGVLSVYVLPKSSVVIIQLEYFTLVEWCLVVIVIFITFYVLFIIF